MIFLISAIALISVVAIIDLYNPNILSRLGDNIF